MCLLVVCDANSTPTEEELLQGACRNPDGFGFAIMTPDGIISERTMSAKKSIRRFLELRAQYPSAYALWHCRIATHGVKNEDNCHPFQVGGSAMTYLAHNGVLSLPIDENDRRSDTRIFAEEVLPAMGGVAALDDPRVFHILEKWALGSKVVVMTVDPAAKFNLYILNEKSGTWDSDGVWWSNTYHRPAPVYTPPKYASYRYDDSFYDEHRWDYNTKQYVPKESSEAVVSAPKELTTTPTSSTGDNLYHLFSDEIEDGYAPVDCLMCAFPISWENLEEGYCDNCKCCIECGDTQGYCMCYIPTGIILGSHEDSKYDLTN